MKSAFLFDPVELRLDQILPSRLLKPEVKQSSRYATIAATVREMGIVEPLVVYPQAAGSGKYVLLDGHVRFDVLRELGREKVTCIVALDDENCTFNEHVNHLAPIQANKMILRAIEAGVPEERIANALNVSPKTIRDRRTRLVDIADDAIERLKDKPIGDAALRLLKKAKPFRQVEIAELMCLANNFTAAHARALIAATPVEQLVAPGKPESKPEQLAKLEAEMRAIEREFVALEETYSANTLNLQLARSYLKTLLANGRVGKFLKQRYAEVLEQLQRVVEATSLEG